MHDLMFAKEILAALNGKLNTMPKGVKIVAINAALSPLSHVRPETLTETFGVMVKGTEFEKIALNIKVMPIDIKCRACKHTFQVNEPTTMCIKCNSSDLDMVHGKEFLVESLQVEKY